MWGEQRKALDLSININILKYVIHIDGKSFSNLLKLIMINTLFMNYAFRKVLLGKNGRGICH